MTAEHLETVKDLRNVLMKLEAASSLYWKEGKDFYDENLPESTIRSFEVLPSFIHRISGTELNKFLDENKKRNSIQLYRRIYLPPLEYNCRDNAFIPTLHLDLNFGRNEIKLFLEMYRLREISPKEGTKMHGFGFRFESPHEGSGHDYWHMQITRMHVQHDKEVIFPEWVPQSAPCFAMKARGPISLLCVMLMCLYGSKGFSERILPKLEVDEKYLVQIKNILDKTERLQR